MLVSTIIPTVARPTLSRAVTTVLEQDLGGGAHEVIVVNDSGQPLPPAEWQDCPGVTVLNVHRVERALARNAGAAVARGAHLHFLDDDDFLLPGGLAAMLAGAAATGGAFVAGGVRLVDGEGRLVRDMVPSCRPNMFVEFVVGEVVQCGHALVKREAFFAAGRFDSTVMLSEDATWSAGWR
jgi:glycosyltransferase involved in cell wall biosynthesis